MDEYYATIYVQVMSMYAWGLWLNNLTCGTLTYCVISVVPKSSLTMVLY